MRLLRVRLPQSNSQEEVYRVSTNDTIRAINTIKAAGFCNGTTQIDRPKHW